MAQHLPFAISHQYASNTLGLDLPVLLRSGTASVELVASLDTGASFCIFERALGERLGFAIESGWPQWIGSVRGSFLTYGHEAILSVLGIEITATVYFAEDAAFTRNVLGRQGWLDRVRLGLIDYDSQLYLSAYDDPA
jgi:hypothetical protein